MSCAQTAEPIKMPFIYFIYLTWSSYNSTH